MRIARYLACLALVLPTLAGTNPATAPEGGPASLAAARMEQDGLPSLSIAIARKGELIFSQAWGLADVENSVAATPGTVYRIGSVSKVITATAILQLVEKGRLDLDKPVQSYCPAFPEKPAMVTPRLLLAHLGGIRDYNYRRFTEEFLSSVRYDSVSEALAVFKDDSLVSEPGEKHLYSSWGYVLLGCAVEGAAGVSFAEYIARNVLAPAGMRQSRLDIPEEIVPQRARSYSRSRDGVLQNSPYVDLSDRFPSGGLLSTPSDLVALGRSLLDGKLVTRRTWADMTDRQQTRSGEKIAYGLGLRLSDPPGEAFHGGSSVGGASYLYIRPGSDTVVAFATNVDRWGDPRHALAQALADWAESQ